MPNAKPVRSMVKIVVKTRKKTRKTRNRPNESIEIEHMFYSRKM